MNAHLISNSKLFLTKTSISALSGVSLLLFSSIMLETVLNTLSLSTLVQEAQRYFVEVAARKGHRYLLTPQYWYGLSEAGMVFSVRYPCSWTAGLELLAALGSSHSSQFCQTLA